MRAVLVTRLRTYWKMEAANSVVVPLVGTGLIYANGDTVGWLVAVAMLAASWMLVIGTIALRAHYLTVTGDADAMGRVVPLLARCQTPSAILCVAGLVAAGVHHWQDAAWTASVIAGWVFATLAVLEYVNYYHVQLQHFDHRPDWVRLLAGKGFRASHLARALRRYRAAT